MTRIIDDMLKDAQLMAQLSSDYDFWAREIKKFLMQSQTAHFDRDPQVLAALMVEIGLGTLHEILPKENFEGILTAILEKVTRHDR